MVDDLEIYGVKNIQQVVDFFNGDVTLEPTIVNTREEFFSNTDHFLVDFADVKGKNL